MKEKKMPKINICFRNVCMINQHAWFSADNFNALCYMDLKSHLVHYVASIPNEDFFAQNLYIDIKYVDEKLILTPSCANEIAVYDINTSTFQKYKLKPPKDFGKLPYIPRLKFFSSIVSGHSIYFIARRYPAIVELNLKDNSVLYYDEWLNEIQEYIQYPLAYFRQDVAVQGDSFFLISPSSNIIMEFNTKTKKTALFNGNDIKISYSTITQTDDTLWLDTLHAGSIHIAKIAQNRIYDVNKIKNYPHKFKGGEVNFFHSIQKGDFIYYFPFNANMIIKVNKITANITDILQFSVEEKNGEKKPKLLCVWEYNDCFYFFNNTSLTIDILDKDDQIIDSFIPILSLESKNNLRIEAAKWMRLKAKTTPLMECKNFTLKEFIKGLDNAIS